VTCAKATWGARAGFLASAALFCIASAGLRAQGQTIRVAAAADLKFAMSELAAQYQKQTGNKLEVTYGSSGNFFAQIQNGAPFDLFFSADIEYPRRLEAAGLAEPGMLYEYAIGRIVVWAPPDSQVDVANLGWNALLDASVRKIAMANPQHAPYGRAALAALRKAGIYEQVAGKLVYGENISQAAQFVESGNAQAGIVALSLAVSPAMRDGKRWEIPAEMHDPIKQAAIVLKHAGRQGAARQFLDFVKSAEGRATLERYGFSFPPAGLAREALTVRP
jgi:molybdate transport system substrate-binding protein